MDERWTSVTGFPAYEISDAGSVRRIVASDKGHPAGNAVRPWVNNMGYAIVTLSGPDGPKRRLVSRLVCEAFHGAPPTPQHHAAHGDGDPANNHQSNLRWATRAENMADCLLHGTRAVGKKHGRWTKPEKTPRGEKHGSAKLTDESIRQIRAEPKIVGSGRLLARRFGVSASLICRIRKYKNWSHV